MLNFSKKVTGNTENSVEFEYERFQQLIVLCTVPKTRLSKYSVNGEHTAAQLQLKTCKELVKLDTCEFCHEKSCENTKSFNLFHRYFDRLTNFTLPFTL